MSRAVKKVRQNKWLRERCRVVSNRASAVRRGFKNPRKKVPMRHLNTLLIASTLTAAACSSRQESPVQTTTNTTATKSTTPPVVATAIRKGHIAANGVNYYYEIRGQREPLLV